MLPNRISNGEVIAGRFLTRTSYRFPDNTEYTTALVHYLSCFDLTTQTGSTTTPNAFIFGTTDIAKGFSVVSDGTNLTKIKAAHGGVYNFQWSGQFTNSINTDKDIYVWFRINGTDVVGSTGVASIPASHGAINGHALIGWNFFLTLQANDEVQLMWLKEDDGVSLPFLPGTASYPSTASVVLTVNQIA